jgi:3-hydroxyisobutyrate dehydrogenase
MSSAAPLRRHRIGWAGAGRMGLPMVTRLLKAGNDVTVYNRTRSKAEPLTAFGATLVDSAAALSDCDIVFTMLGGPADVIEIVAGPQGILSRSTKPKLIVDSSTISMNAAQQVRTVAMERGSAMLDAPVSGNPWVVEAGRLVFICSGSRADFELAKPYLDILGQSATYAGEGELARIVKICHNTYLGVIIQALAEVTILANKAGVPRHALLDFINNSALGSTFSRYKTPAFVNLEYHPTFTPPLLQKDMDLGLAAARQLQVSMPVASVAREMVQNLVARGYLDCDFAAIIELEAEASGMHLEPENIAVDRGI